MKAIEYNHKRRTLTINGTEWDIIKVRGGMVYLEREVCFLRSRKWDSQKDVVERRYHKELTVEEVKEALK